MRTVGACKNALDLMCKRAVSRTTRDGKLADLQMVQADIADSWIALESFRLMVLRTAWLIDKHQDYQLVRKDIAAIKVMMPKVYNDIATKAAVGGGVRLAFIPVLLGCQAVGFVCLQLGFQRGGAIATAGVATLLTNSVPIAAGVFVFGDRVPGGYPGTLRIAAFVIVTAGAALLARPEGSGSDEPAPS